MSLKLCKGGSHIKFSQNLTCCIKSCRATMKENSKIPFYTFPSDPFLCKQWLKEIRLDDIETEALEKLHTTHVVCPKHFKMDKEGMKLCVDKYDCQENMKSVIKNKTVPSTNKVSSSTELCQCNDLCDLNAKIDTNFYSSNKFTQRKYERTGNLGSKKHTSKTNIHKNDSEKKEDTEDNYDNTNAIKNLNEKSVTNEYLNSKLGKNNSNTVKYIKKEIRNHKIKILISSKDSNVKNGELSKDVHDEIPDTSSTNKIIYVEFGAEYIICHDREWVYKINVDENQLKYPQETINNILKIIHSTIKKQCEQYNSTVVSLPVPPLYLDRVTISPSQQQIQTETIIMNGKQQVNVKLGRETIEVLKKKEPILKCLFCKKCDLKLENTQSLIKHIKYFHPRPCRFCKENITPLEKLILHEKEHLKPSTEGFVCDLCGHQFKTPKSFNYHFKKHQHQKRFCCTMCKLQFNNGFGLRKHLGQQHKELLTKKKCFKCSKCELWLSSKLTLQAHKKTHLPIEERMKTCPDCKKIFINSYRFKIHIENHGPCPIKCPECPRSFPNQKHLDNHLYSHKITEPVYCDICQRNFKTRITFKNHIVRVHQGVQYVKKTFTCLFCNIVFTNKDKLKMHSATHTVEEKVQAFTGDQNGKVQCNECNKYFLFKSRLILHKRYHHISPCAQCGKHIAGDFMKHCCKPRGSRALQYCCQYCTKRFSSKQRLNLHERIHGLNYHFRCMDCSKWFTKASALKTHRYSHSNILQYICKLCGQMCKLESTLKKHMKLCHKIKDNDNLDPDHISNAITLLISGNESGATHLAAPLILPISTPVTDEQNYLTSDVSDHIDTSHVDVLNQQLQSVGIVDVQNINGE